LALQLIAIHKTMYESMCVDLHLVPYRVTATAPGVSCFFEPRKCMSLSFGRNQNLTFRTCLSVRSN
jgi:hypothetical protein